MGYFGYNIVTGGKTCGSRVAFSNDKKDYIRMHKPHPRSILKSYQVQNLIEDFHEAVDEYLEFCKEDGKEPQQ